MLATTTRKGTLKAHVQSHPQKRAGSKEIQIMLPRNEYNQQIHEMSLLPSHKISSL